MDILKSTINNEIMDKINNGVKNGINGNDCVNALIVNDNFNINYTKENQIQLTNILNNVINIDDSGVNFTTNNNLIDTLYKLINQVTLLQLDKTSNSTTKKILSITFNQLFNLNIKKYDYFDKFISFKIMIKKINIKSFVKSFVKAYLYVNNYILINYNNQVRVATLTHFNNIKKSLSQNYYNEMKKSLEID